jgi:hypothetical protein
MLHPPADDFDFAATLNFLDLPMFDTFSDFSIELSEIPRSQSPLPTPTPTPPPAAKPIRPLVVVTTPAIFRPFITLHAAEIVVQELPQCLADTDAGERTPLPMVQGIRRELFA